MLPYFKIIEETTLEDVYILWDSLKKKKRKSVIEKLLSSVDFGFYCDIVQDSGYKII